MRLDQLPSLRHGVNGMQLQREVWRALNFTQTMSEREEGASFAAADALRTFLNQCLDLVPQAPVLPKEKTNA